MMVRKEGHFSIRKDGSSYYRVYRKRTRIGSFLHLARANGYFDMNVQKEKEEQKDRLK